MNGLKKILENYIQNTLINIESRKMVFLMLKTLKNFLKTKTQTITSYGFYLYLSCGKKSGYKEQNISYSLSLGSLVFLTMSTFNLQEGIKGDEGSKPAPNSFILSVPGKPLVEPPEPVLYRKEPCLYHLPKVS